MNQLARAFEYLDQMRADGDVNMAGARPYLAEEFSLDRATSAKILGDWMKSFDPEKSPAERAAEFE